MTQSEITRIVQELVEASELSAALESLEAYLRKSKVENETLNSLILLKSRNQQNDKDFKLNNILTKEDFDTERNRIQLALLGFLEEIPAISEVNKEELAELLKQNKLQQKKIGKILYSIPNEMQVSKAFTCIIRIGTETIDKELLMEDIADTNITHIENLPRISEVMKVNLCEIGSSNFEIISLNSQAEQVITEGEYTEWKFRVKPLLAGEHTLFLQVSVIEIIPNFGERRKDIKVLEKIITVVTAPVEEKKPVFEASNNSFVPLISRGSEQPKMEEAVESEEKSVIDESDNTKGIEPRPTNIKKPIGVLGILGGLKIGTWAAASSVLIGVLLGTFYINLPKDIKHDDVIVQKQDSLKDIKNIGIDTINPKQVALQDSLKQLKQVAFQDSINAIKSTVKHPIPKQNPKNPKQKNINLPKENSTPNSPSNSNKAINNTILPTETTNATKTETKPATSTFVPPVRVLPEAKNINKIRRKVSYPTELEKSGKEGEVLCSVYVDENGKYIKHTIISSPDPLFTAAVEKHIMELKFEPAKQNDKPVKCWVNVPFRFSVKDK